MKLAYVRLLSRGLQCSAGRLGDLLEDPTYELTLIANLRSVKVNREGWKTPVFIPLERLSNYSPDPEAIAPKK